MKGTISDALTRLLFFVYSDRVERVTKWLGVHRLLAASYWAVQSRFHGDRVTVSVAGSETTFSVSTVWEFYRFQSLMGEDKIIADVLDELSTDDVFFDIGANVGMYTCFVAQHLPPGNVIAFEPHPENVVTLKQNLDLNGVGASIQEYGLADTEADGSLAVGQEGSGEGRHSIAVDEAANTIPIRLRRGDALIADGKIPAPTVLKIDVEGAEVSVLKGLSTALRNDCRLCYVEVHPDRLDQYGNTIAELNALFASNGFEVESIEERNEEEYFLKATKVTSPSDL